MTVEGGRRRAVVGVRERVISKAIPEWERGIKRYFALLEDEVLARFRTAKATSVDPVRYLRNMLTNQYLRMTKTVWSDVVGEQVGRKIDFNLNQRGVAAIIDRVGTRITRIDESSRRAIARAVQRGIDENANADKIEANLRSMLRSWGESGGRAHIIALTETGFAFNYSALEGYRGVGVGEVRVYDGPDCGWREHDDPDLADGSIRTIEEANAYPLSHPHCQRAFSPVVETEVPEELPTFERVVEEEVDPVSLGAPVVRSREEVLSQVSDEIRMNELETAIAVSDDGRVLWRQAGQQRTGATYGSVEMTEEQLIAARGQTIVHNHPGAIFEGWDHAGSFSTDDVRTGITWRVGEIRAVGKGVDYVARFDPDLSADEVFAAFSEIEPQVREEFNEYIADAQIRARKLATRPDGSFDVSRYDELSSEAYKFANMEHWHRVWERVAMRVPGFRYERRFISGAKSARIVAWSH